MSTPEVAYLTTHVRRRVADDPTVRSVFRSADPPERRVELRSHVWRSWLLDGGPRSSPAALDPLEGPATGAVADARKRLVAVEGDVVALDREALLDLSVRAARSGERACTALFVATMMWGAGQVNGRAPWRTAEALRSEHLTEALVTSHRRLRDGDVAGAFACAQAIPSCGEQNASRWLWAAALSMQPLHPQPLITDDRRREAFHRASDPLEMGPPAGRGLRAYLAYVGTITAAATALRSDGLRHATPEKIEWLLALEVP